MSKVGQEPTPDPRPTFISGTDLTDEIRRHLRTLEIITQKGDGTTILSGQQVQVVDTDPALLQKDIQKVLDEMRGFSETLAFKMTQAQND
jgi:L-2-hydroxyglutarate oxidase LhgO